MGRAEKVVLAYSGAVDTSGHSLSQTQVVC